MPQLNQSYGLLFMLASISMFEIYFSLSVYSFLCLQSFSSIQIFDQKLLVLMIEHSSQIRIPSDEEQQVFQPHQIALPADVHSPQDRLTVRNVLPIITILLLTMFINYFMPAENLLKEFIHEWNITDVDHRGNQQLIQKWRFVPERTQKMKDLEEGNSLTFADRYFAYRLKIWGDDSHGESVDFEYNYNKYNVGGEKRKLSICIMVEGQLTKSFIRSITRQKYQNYHTIIYDKSNNGQKLIPHKYKYKFQFKKTSPTFSDCNKDDVTLALQAKGQLIGSFVLERLNNIYTNNSSIKMTYSHVLTLCEYNKIPKTVSWMDKSRTNEELFVNGFFGHYLWSFKSNYYSEFDKFLTEVKKSCPSIEVGKYTKIVSLGLKIFQTDQIRAIDEFQYFSNRTESSLQKCLQQAVRKETSLEENVFKEMKPKMKQIFTMSDTKVEEVISELRQIPEKTKLWYHFPNEENPRKPTEKTYFPYRLSLNPYNDSFRQVQYNYFDGVYHIGQPQKQLPICIISAGRNINENRVVQKYLDAVGRQNYTNYKVVYVDDCSDDGSPDQMEKLLFYDHPEMKEKVTIVRNKERIYSLGNRNKAVKEYCEEDDIIVDLDADDQLIGHQVLKLFNSIYQTRKDIWLVYTNNVIFEESLRQPILGVSAQIKPQHFRSHTTRLHSFTVSNLRSFSRKLYMKIDEKNFKDRQGRFYKWVGDYFIYMALAELSGPERIVYCNQMVIKYSTSSNYGNLDEKKKYALMVKEIDPFQELQSIDDTPTKYISPISVKLKDQLIDSSLKFYDSMEATRKGRLNYNPFYERNLYEQDLKKMVAKNKISFISSTEESIKFAILANELKNNRTFGSYNLEKYFYDNRMQVLFYRYNLIPFIVVIEAEEVEKYFEQLFDSLISQEYNEEKFIFLYDEYEEYLYMYTFTMKHYPMLLEKTAFLKMQQYPTLSSILAQFCQTTSVVIQLSMKSAIIGSQSFNFINALFKSHSDVDLIAASSMMVINQSKIQVKEVGQSLIGDKFQYLSYHKEHKGIIAIRVEPDKRLKEEIRKERIMWIPNVLSSFTYEDNLNKFFQFKVSSRYQAVILGKKKIMSQRLQKVGEVEERKIKKISLKSYLSQNFWQYPLDKTIMETQTYYYKKHNNLGKYKGTLPFCIVAIAVHQNNFQRFITSLSHQQYQNYSLVFAFLNANQSYANKELLSNKIRVVQNIQQPFNQSYLQIKAQLVRKHCKNDEFVIDIDGNDEFVGRQSIGLLNVGLQEKPETWFLVANCLHKDADTQLVFPAVSHPKTNNFESFFYLDRIKVYKKQFFLNVVKQLQIKQQSELNLAMIQLSGQRFYFFNQFLSFDHKTDRYIKLSDESIGNIWSMLNNPYQQLKFPSDSFITQRGESSNFFEVQMNDKMERFLSKKIISKLQLDKNKKLQAEKEETIFNLQLKSETAPLAYAPIHMFNRLRRSPLKPENLNAEEEYYSKVYKMDKKVSELAICVISVNDNIKDEKIMIEKYIETFAKMNYNNLSMVHMDNSPDGRVTTLMKQYISQKYPQLLKKLKIIRQSQPLPLLHRKDKIIRSHCNESDIILDFDFQNLLLGQHFLKLLNSLYQKEDKWFIYTNYFIEKDGKVVEGESAPIPNNFLKGQSYRRKAFVTFGIRSFLRKLFMKIDQTYFKRKNSVSLNSISDTLLYDAVVELSGSSHSLYIPETPLFVKEEKFLNLLTNQEMDTIFFKIKPPFECLQNLSSPITTVSLSSSIDLEGQIEESIDYYAEKLICKGKI